VKEILGRSPSQAVAYVGRKLARRILPARRDEALPASAPDAPLDERVADVERRCRAAHERYVPGRYGGSLTMLRAVRISHWSFVDPSDPTCGWDRLVSGRVRVHEIDCEHLEVFREPHIGTLGRLIHEAFAAHEAAPRGDRRGG
jgi:thioesterase domain-containing protein